MKHWTASAAILLFLLGSTLTAPAATPPERPPIRALFLVSGGYHDYKTLVPFLTRELSQRLEVRFETHWGLDRLNDPNFADPFDVIVYDVCDDEAPDAALDHALRALHAGKPAVMIHCAIHAFRKSSKISEWEGCCGLRSKFHDPYGSFTVTRVDPAHPITRAFPQLWTTPGDELYQMISIDAQSVPLLKAKSPRDGREHVVCWTYQHGKGRVFATTLGHDMKTTAAPEYVRLLADGMLWACQKLRPDGSAAPGYARNVP